MRWLKSRWSMRKTGNSLRTHIKINQQVMTKALQIIIGTIGYITISIIGLLVLINIVK